MSNYNDLFGKKVQVQDAPVQQNEVFEQSTKQLPTTVPVLKDDSGREIKLEVLEITAIGSSAGVNISKMSDSILNKVKVADTELGDGIGKILSLTSSVDISKLGNKERTGLLGKLITFGRDTKQKVLAEFETVQDQVQKIADTLSGGVQRMRGESVWLDTAYNENIKYLRQLEVLHINVSEVFAASAAELEELVANQSSPIELIDSKRIIVNALDKQKDKLARLIQLAKLTAPQIRSMQVVNTNTIEKYESIQSIVIPAWKQQMGLALISLQQSKDLELANNIDDATNKLFRENADLMGSNMVEAAKSAQRSVVDLETLQHVQDKTLAAIRETMSVEAKGREDRKQAAIAIQKMDQDLQNELRDITSQSRK